MLYFLTFITLKFWNIPYLSKSLTQKKKVSNLNEHIFFNDNLEKVFKSHLSQIFSNSDLHFLNSF